MSTPHIENKVYRRFPVLNVNERLLLREPRTSDAAAYLTYINHPEVARYVPDSCLPKNEAQAATEMQWNLDLYTQHKSIAWSIVDRQTQTMVGCISFESWTRYHRRIEIAYDLNPMYWRQGIMTQCLAKVFEYAFDVMEVNRIEAFTTTYNAPSIALLTKMGFEQDGLLKSYRWFKNAFIDVMIFGYTRKQYQAEHGLVQRMLLKIRQSF